MKVKENKYTEILRWAYAKQDTSFTEKELFAKFNSNDDPNFKNWYLSVFRGGQTNDDCIIGLYKYINNTHYLCLTARGMSAVLSLNKEWYEKPFGQFVIIIVTGVLIAGIVYLLGWS
jgi:hypothetical protein